MQEDIPVQVELQRMLEQFQNRPFPEDSGDEEASLLHDELVELDGYLMGRLLTLANGGRLSLIGVQVCLGLRQRLEKVANSGSPGFRDARSYLDYLAELENLLIHARPLFR